MPEGDPYRPKPPLEYECVECGRRVRAEHSPGKCTECGGQMRDLSVPWE